MPYRLLLVAFAIVAAPLITSAHAVVSPFQAPTETYQDFSLSVPNEKDVPTVGVRLLIPGELTKATPFVKPGWKITVTKVGDAVTQIEWSGGKIPVGLKDTFQFTTVTPKDNATLVWKVYQTYEGGTIVAWDRDPKTPAPSGKVENPYSTTDVRNDVFPVGLPMQKEKPNDNSSPIIYFALVISIVALGVSLWRRRG